MLEQSLLCLKFINGDHREISVCVNSTVEIILVCHVTLFCYSDLQQFSLLYL